MDISKSDSIRYRQEVKQGVDIFQKSFKEAAETKDFPEKKDLFDKSAKEAMQAIGDAAKALMNKEILAQKEKLEKDYNDYQRDPSAENSKKIAEDIKSFKNILE